MTAAERKKLEEQLLQLREELAGKGSLKVAPNRAAESDIGDDEDEQPLNEMMQSIASARNRNNVAVLARIARALRKLATEPDELGLCEECGERISKGRLAAMPYAEFCVVCQGKRDPGTRHTRRHLTDFR